MGVDRSGAELYYPEDQLLGAEEEMSPERGWLAPGTHSQLVAELGSPLAGLASWV